MVMIDKSVFRYRSNGMPYLILNGPFRRKENLNKKPRKWKNEDGKEEKQKSPDHLIFSLYSQK